MFSLFSTLHCETKQDDTNTDPYLSYLVQPNLHGKRQRLPSLKVLWMNIFSYSGPTEKETASLRRSCKLFSKALKPVPYWTSYPHPKYSSLTGLFGRINELSQNGSTNLPKLVLIDNGIHDVPLVVVVVVVLFLSPLVPLLVLPSLPCLLSP